MSQNVIYVGIDVDDVRYHGCAVDPHTGEALEFQCRPTLTGLVRQLEKIRAHLGRVHLKLCYEASYVGFSLQRDLRLQGYDCEVVAPTSIPRRPGKAVKTDRIDASDLAQYYSTSLLTVVATPDAQLEADRDLLRSRQHLVQQQGMVRKHLQSLFDLNLKVVLEGKTELGKPTWFDLGKRAAGQRQAPGDRLWSPRDGPIFLRYPARGYEVVSPRSYLAPDHLKIQVGSGGVYMSQNKPSFRQSVPVSGGDEIITSSSRARVALGPSTHADAAMVASRTTRWPPG